eukprot:13974061-Ditylum_brightwellii.AAC.1
MALNRETYKARTAHSVDAILSLEDFNQDIHQATMETGRASGVVRKDVAYKQVKETVEDEYTNNQK